MALTIVHIGVRSRRRSQSRKGVRMKRYMLLCVVAGFGLIGVGGQALADPPDCEPARCATQSGGESARPCVGGSTGTVSANHGRYVSCVAHEVNRLAKSGDVPNNCKGKIRRCAARPICGKEGAVICLIPRPGTCDTTAGTCVESGLPCLSDADCVEMRCKMKRSADLCMEKGGTVDTTATSCCPGCGG